MTTSQRDAISSPAQGLMIFNTDAGALQVYSMTYSGPASQINYSNGTSYSTGGDGAWQQFTPTTSGYLNQINLYQSNPMNSNIVAYPYQMNIYSGVTSTNGSSLSGGSVIGSTIAYIPASAAQNPQTISYVFTNPIYLKANTSYYFRITHYNGSLSAYYGDTYFYSSQAYTGNNSWIGGFNQTLNFQTFMSSPLSYSWISMH